MNTQDFVKKIENKTARVGVIGLGYVGIPLVLEFGRQGYHVLGFDVDPVKVRMINAGQSYIKHIGPERIAAMVKDGLFEATADYARLPEVDAVLIAVPTPLDHHREPDMKYVVETGKAMAPHLRAGQLVVLESTTYPGTTEDLLKPILEAGKGGLVAGRDFYLAFSPEREDPGNKHFNTSTIAKVVGGLTPDCLTVACALYGKIIGKVVPVSSCKVAEMSKLLENIFRNVNIGLVNELKMLTDRMDIDIWEVISAASTKPFGFMPFYPGPGLGGHCIPIDPFYLTWKAREYDCPTRLIETSGEINTQVTEWVVEKLARALNDRKKAVNGSKVLVLGMAYKRDIDDLRESPSLKLLELLKDRGAEVSYNDPHIPRVPILSPMRHYDFHMESQALTAEYLASLDAVLVSTDHSSYDWEFICTHAPLVVDTRNACVNVKANRERIVKA
ncbi:MAG: nucleotide sugar dehydrogenase [Deltaproteobacteria bacterium HGW-Deltaproteobacteria-22]|jgi:UDP-N-acetyl-D-glucosamine dehydrogenase|nr:MAG: nucleotide sugar dehydrogenase [Deltaproteobacteria bacterium HGW-Deltaproteobacteria-22]